MSCARTRAVVVDDHSRVKLANTGSTDPGADYINANFIKDELHGEVVYIAAQGPLPATVVAFWQMIFEQNCRVIMMLTNEVEGGKARLGAPCADVRRHPVG